MRLMLSRCTGNSQDVSSASRVERSESARRTEA